MSTGISRSAYPSRIKQGFVSWNPCWTLWVCGLSLKGSVKCRWRRDDSIPVLSNRAPAEYWKEGHRANRLFDWPISSIDHNVNEHGHLAEGMNILHVLQRSAYSHQRPIPLCYHTCLALARIRATLGGRKFVIAIGQITGVPSVRKSGRNYLETAFDREGFFHLRAEWRYTVAGYQIRGQVQQVEEYLVSVAVKQTLIGDVRCIRGLTLAYIQWWIENGMNWKNYSLFSQCHSAVRDVID